MSLILEALRKSEAERRRAQVPDLLAEPQPVAPVAKQVAPRWPLVAGAVVVLAGLAWFALRDRTVDATDTIAAADGTSALPIETASQPTPAPRPVAPRREQRPLVIAPPAPAVAPNVAPPATRAASPAANTVAAASPPPPNAAPAPSPPAPIATPAPTTRDNAERLSDLAPDERKSLPPLKLSMHMWNDAPTQRFVIIDGTRLVMGDHLGPLVVSDIVPDGVVLDWNGRALKLPLR